MEINKHCLPKEFMISGGGRYTRLYYGIRGATVGFVSIEERPSHSA